MPFSYDKLYLFIYLFFFSLDEITLCNLIEEIVILITPLVKVRPDQMAPVLNDILVSLYLNLFIDSFEDDIPYFV